MKPLTKDELSRKVYWIVDGENILRSGTYAEALRDKADYLDLKEIPKIVDRVVHDRQELGIGGRWSTIARHTSFIDAESAAQDDERILTRRIWDVEAGKDLICPCDTEEDAELELLEYLRKAEIDRDIMVFDREDYAELYQAVVTGVFDFNENLRDIIVDLVMEQAIML